MTYQDTNTMIDLLKKAHEVQIKIAELNDGHSIHIDQSSHENLLPWSHGEHHISFDVTLFEDHSLEESWTFDASDSYDELMHIYEDMMFHINRL